MVACIAGIPVCFRQSFLGEKEWGKQKAAAWEEEGLKNGEGEGGNILFTTNGSPAMQAE